MWTEWGEGITVDIKVRSYGTSWAKSKDEFYRIRGKEWHDQTFRGLLKCFEQEGVEEQEVVMAGPNLSNGENGMSPGQVSASSPVFKDCTAHPNGQLSSWDTISHLAKPFWNHIDKYAVTCEASPCAFYLWACLVGHSVALPFFFFFSFELRCLMKMRQSDYVNFN